MPLFNVHLYPIVRVLVSRVEASSMEEAINKAETQTDLGALFLTEDSEWAEETSHYLVDDLADPEFEHSMWFGPGLERGFPDLFMLVKDLLAADPKDLPAFFGINDTTDKIIALRLRKD
jgi:hypothetical protein